VSDPSSLAGKLLGATHITTDEADFFVLARAKSMDAAGRDKAIAELRASLASANTMSDIVSYVNNEAALKLVEWRAQSGSSLSLQQISEALRGSAGSSGVYNVELAIQRLSTEVEETMAEEALAVDAKESEKRDYDAYLQLKKASMGKTGASVAAPGAASSQAVEEEGPTSLTPEAMFMMQRERLLGRALTPDAGTAAPKAKAAAAAAAAAGQPTAKAAAAVADKAAAELPAAVNADNMYAQIRLQQVRDRLATASVQDTDDSLDTTTAQPAVDVAAASAASASSADHEELLLNRYQARLLQRDPAATAAGAATEQETASTGDESLVAVSEAELSAEERYTNIRMQSVREKLGLPPAPLMKKKVPVAETEGDADEIGGRLCWVCGERGTHLARGCPQRYDRKHPEAAAAPAPTTTPTPAASDHQTSTNSKSQKWVS
jgi:hypothetical protein